MKPGLRRRLAILACRALLAVLPPQLRLWAWAVRAEVAQIVDDTEALLFALHSLCGIAPRAIAGHLLRPFAGRRGDDIPSSKGTIPMRFGSDFLRDPRSIGLACAAGAAMLGLAYMAMADAPARYLGVNAAALLTGLVLFALAVRTAPEGARWPGALTLVTATALLLTALFGDRVEGAARWITVGGFFVQPSLILLPVTIVGFARSRNALSIAGMLVAAAALAIQPDRAMAGVLAAGLMALALLRPDRLSIPALAGAIAAFAVTLIRADTLPAVPYVDRILYSSFEVHPLAGLAVLGGAALLLIPAIAGARSGAGHREAHAVFGAVWLAAILAAALGNYPTPVVGYGGSAILGYVLSLTMLPRPARAPRAADAAARDGARSPEADRHLCVGAA